MSFAIAYFLNKVLQHQSLIKLNNKKFNSSSDQSNTITTNEMLANLPVLSNELNLFIRQLISMFQKCFLNETDSSSLSTSTFVTHPSETSQSPLAIKDFDLFSQYKNEDLFSLFNLTHTNHSSNQFRLFPFIFTLMRICFAKCHQINSSLVANKFIHNVTAMNESAQEAVANREATAEAADVSVQSAQLSSSFVHQTENDKIKNIDDPSSDDEQHLLAIVAAAANDGVTESKELKNEEDSEDYYMISNLFDEPAVPHFQQQKSVSLPLISQSSSNSTSNPDAKTVAAKQDAEELTFDLNIQATSVSIN